MATDAGELAWAAGRFGRSASALMPIYACGFDRDRLDLSAEGTVAALLPPKLAPIVGDHAALSLHAAFGERIVVDRLSLVTASGAITGNGAFGEPGEGLAAHLRAEVPDLSKFAVITGTDVGGSAALSAEISGTKAAARTHRRSRGVWCRVLWFGGGPGRRKNRDDAKRSA